jgi:hypothetical protein
VTFPRTTIVLLVMALTSCSVFVPLSPDELSQPINPAAGRLEINNTLPGPDPGAGLPLQTLHFVIEGYGSIPTQLSTVVESIYAEVMNQTALYSFKPKHNYRVVIYKTPEEFRAKTGQPEWSGGMKTGTSVFTYEQAMINVVLAHEITHVIFGEFMQQSGFGYRWLNEGLAMYIEAHFDPVRNYEGIRSMWNHQIRENIPMDIESIVKFSPYSEEAKYVSVWYSTVASMTGFLIQRGSALNFSLFLKELKNGTDIERAIQLAYPGKFNSLQQLYDSWRGSLN